MSEINEEDWQTMSAEERLELQVKNCIFCKIVKGEIPSYKVYEDSDFLGILDKNPGSKGHVLLLSKNHIQVMPQLGSELAGKLGVATKNVSKKLKGALGVKCVSVFVANGGVAGQNAPHFMLHIIPRYEEDGVNLDPELKNVDEKSIVALRDKFVSALSLPALSTDTNLSNYDVKSDTSVGEKEDNSLDDVTLSKNDKKYGAKNEVDKDLLDKLSKFF